MGWFDEQIRERKKNDDEVFSESLGEMIGAVSGKKFFSGTGDARKLLENEIGEIFKFYGLERRELPDSVKDFDEGLEYLLRPCGIMRREVVLKDGWYRGAVGPMLARRVDGTPAALLPDRHSRLTFTDRESGKTVRVTEKNAGQFENAAVCFYKPFPLESLDIKELWRCIAAALSRADVLYFAGAALAVMLIGVLIPSVYHILFQYVIGTEKLQPLLAIAGFLVCVNISMAVIGSAKNLLTARLTGKARVTVQSSVMMRILSLPAKFFKDYSAGALANKLSSAENLCEMLSETVISVGLTSLFSLVYLVQVFVYAKELWVYAVLTLLASVLFSVGTALVCADNARERLKRSAKENGMSYALITGIQKIKLAGAEKRAFARWGKVYAQSAEVQYRPPLLVRVSETVSAMIPVFGGIVIYYVAAAADLSMPDFYAFHSAFGLVSGAFLTLSSVAVTLAGIRPVLEELQPLFETAPEVSVEKQVVSRLSGGVELNHVTFRYAEGMQKVVDDLSLKIRPGQYVAIVGKTGCGKSTLMRLMLGFETPDKGAVYYDGKDLAKLDLRSLRRKIGVVMQDERLFQGDIFSNIAISAPGLTLEGAWEAAELAGAAEDIRNMPMGMSTLISEGSGGVSGGQRQRILIARAIASKPKLIMFDEATSALDNITQKIVSDSLARIKCTRIVIAHRLSTIRHCGRIIVLDKGKIVEDGTYDELLERKGAFAELVERQKI